MNSGAPYDYSYINAENATLLPSTIHVQDSKLTYFFRRYLLQKALSIFKWELPPTWDKDYFLYSLFGYGFVAVINTDKYAVIPQHCTLGGFNIFYKPLYAVITNPLLTGGHVQPVIDKQCTLIKLQPDYGSIMDLVNYYAGMLALSSETMETNLINSKLAYVAYVSNETESKTFKKLYDDIISGEPAVVVDKGKASNRNDAKNYGLFNQNVKQNYIVSDLLADMRKLTQMFLTDIGVGNANTDKKERLIQAEVNSNNEETLTMAELWLEQLKEDALNTNKMFGTKITVDWRIKPVENNYREIKKDGDVNE